MVQGKEPVWQENSVLCSSEFPRPNTEARVGVFFWLNG